MSDVVWSFVIVLAMSFGALYIFYREKEVPMDDVKNITIKEYPKCEYCCTGSSIVPFTKGGEITKWKCIRCGMSTSFDDSERSRP